MQHCILTFVRTLLVVKFSVHENDVVQQLRDIRVKCPVIIFVLVCVGGVCTRLCRDIPCIIFEINK